MARSVRVVISGRVQGVGFRAFVEREAIGRGLSGWVRNRRDGSVEAVFSGDDAAIEAMMAACHQGPPSAAVAKVAMEDYAGPVPPGFGERPTE